MEELYINSVLVELTSGSISQTKQINDIGQLKDRQANYSNNIKIPKTSDNIATLGMLGLTGSSTRVPYQTVDVKYILDGVELIVNGKGIVKNTNDYYNLVIYDGNISMSDLLGDKELKTLDFSAYNHTLTSTVFTSSFANTSGYIYALGKFHNLALTDVFSVNDMTPLFYVHTLFDMIFTQKGYTVIGDIFSNTDYLSRVTSVSQGYEIIETASKTKVFNRDNTTDPLISESFGVVKTIKDYVIDSHLAATTSVYNITLNGSINVTKGQSAKFVIKVNGLQNQIIGIGNLLLIDVDVDVVANAGETIDIIFQIESEDDAGTEKIIFDTAYITTLSTNDISIPINFEDIIGDTRQIDFVKDIMQRFGLIFRKTHHKNEFEFIQISELLKDRSSAEDWTDKFSYVLNENYKPNYAQENNLLYKYDATDTNITPTFGDGAISIDNVNLSKTKTLFTSIFKASVLDGNLYKLDQWDDERIPKVDGLRLFKISKVTDTISYNFKKEITGSFTFSGTVAYLDFSSIYYQSEIERYYKEFRSMITNFKQVSLNLNLSLLDIYNLDFFKLKYFNQLGKYYYLNKVVSYKKNKLTRVELVEVGDEVRDGLSMIASYGGSSVYSATLTKSLYGSMTASYVGSSVYSATLRLQVLTSFLMSTPGVAEGSVCAETNNTTFYHNGISSLPSRGDTVYSDAAGLNPVVGASLFFKIPLLQYIQINNSGKVLIKSICE